MVGTALVGVEPQGVAVNSQGDLYSASFQDYPCPGSATGAWITPRPWQKGSLCLPTGGYPIGVAVARDGVVAVMVKGSSAADYIVFFRPKSATPCSTITGASFPVLTGRGAFDRHGNLYVTGYGPGGSVGEAVGQCKARTVKDVGIASLPNATGIRVDTAGNIGVLWNSDSFENAVNVYQPGSTSPSQTIELNGLYEATDFVFVEGGRNIWVTDWLDRNTGGSEAYKYAYPGGGSPVGPGVFSSRSTFNSIAALPIVQPGGAQ
jgi:streptogramin lyase